MPAAPPLGIVCTLYAPAAVGLSESVVPITFTLENAGPAPVRVLARQTPLEGLLGDMFEVTLDGRPIPYHGRMVKRGPPAADEFHALAPGEHAHATIDLLEGYDLSSGGSYRVRFTRRDDFACNELLIKRN
jgi:hypothetical protein